MSISSMLTYLMMGLNARFATIWGCQYILALTSTALGVLIGCSVTDPEQSVEVRRHMPTFLFVVRVNCAAQSIPLSTIAVSSYGINASDSLCRFFRSANVNSSVVKMANVCLPSCLWREDSAGS